MSENQSLVMIENKLDNLERMLDQQSKSGLYFDGFTKQVLENIHNKLEYISNFETNELITYLTEEMKRTMDDKHNVLQLRLDNFQGLINNVQANLSESLKTPEIIQTFNKLSDSILDFSRDLNSQTRYFSSTVENIHNDLGRINLDSKLEAQTNEIRAEVEAYKTNVSNFADDINENFETVKRIIAENAPSEALVALSGDVSVIQKGLNDVINAVVAVNAKQGDLISSIAGISAGTDVQDIRVDVSSMLTEMQVLKEALRVLVNKSDIEAINEKLNYAIESVSNIKELASYNDNENKTIFKTYFNDLSSMLSSVVSKEEGELIKSKLDFIQTGLEDGKQGLKELIEQSNSRVAGLLDGFSTSHLATKENLNDFSQSTINAIDSITAQWNDKIVQNSEALEKKLEGFRSALSSIYEAVSLLSTKVGSSTGNDIGNGLLKEDITEILSHIESTKSYLSQHAQTTDANLSSKLSGIADFITEKTGNLENLVNNLQDGLKDSLSDNIAQLKDFSQNLIVSVSDFGGQLNLKTEAINSVLNNHYNDLSSKIEAVGAQYDNKTEELKSELTENYNALRDRVSSIGSQYDAKTEEIKAVLNESHNSLGDKVSEVGSQYDAKLEEIKSVLFDNHNGLSSKVAEVSDQYGLKADEIKSVINERYSNLSGQVASVSEQYSLKTEELKSVLEDRCNNLNDRVVAVAKQYAEFAGANKSEILNELESLKTIAQASTSALYDDKVYSLFDERIRAIEDVIQASKNELLTANLNITEAASGQITILDTINNSIKDLYINISDGRVSASGHKDEIVNSVSQKIYDLTNLVDTLRKNIESEFNENKAAIENEIGSVKVISEDIKSALNEINHNQASKEILAAILENVTGKLDEVSNLISLNKDFSLDQYDSIKQLNNDLKNSISDIIIHLNQSSEFANSLFDRMSTGFAQTVESITAKTVELKDELSGITSEQKEEVIAKVDSVQTQLGTIQHAIESFNFDESVKEQLLDLKNQIASFNQQSLVDILNRVTENNEQTGQNVQNTINGIKLGFDSLMNKVGNIEIQTNVLREEIIKQYTDSLKELSDKVEIISGNLETNAYHNKEQILNELASLQDYSTDLRDEIKSVNENMLKSDFVVEQTDRLSSLINNFVASFSARFDEISNTDKGYVAQAVKESFNEFQQQISNSINYLKSLNLNLDRSLSSTQSALLEGMDAVNANTNKTLEELTSAKTELVGKVDSVATTVTDLLVKNSEQRQQIKEELSSSINNISTEIQSGLEQAKTIGDAIKEGVSSRLADFEALAEENRTKIEAGQNETKQEVVSALNSISEAIDEKLAQTTEQSVLNKNDIISEISTTVAEKTAGVRDSFNTKLQDTFARLNEKISEFAGGLRENSSNNKEQIVSLVEGLKTSVSSINSDVENLLATSRQEALGRLTEKLDSNINEINEKLNAFEEGFASTSCANKEHLFEAIRQVKDSLEQFRDESKTSAENSGEIIKNELASLLQENLQSSMNRLGSVSEQIQRNLLANKDGIVAEVESVKSALNDQKEAYYGFENKVDEIKTTIVEGVSEKIETINSQISSVIDGLKELGNQDNEEIANQIEKLTLFINDTKSEMNNLLNDRLNHQVQNTQEVIEKAINSINDTAVSLVEKTEEVANVVEGVKEKISETSQRAEELNAEIKQILGTSFANITETLNTGNTDSKEFQENLKYELRKVIDDISSKLLKIDEENSGLKETLLYELQKSYNLVNGKLEAGADTQDKKYAIFEEKIDENQRQTEELIKEESAKLSDSVVKNLAQELDLQGFRETFDNEIAEKTSQISQDIIEIGSAVVQNFKQTNDLIQDAAKLEANFVKGLIEDLELGQIKTALSKEILAQAGGLTERIEELQNYILENKTLYESVSKSNKNDVLSKLDFLKEDIEALTEKSGYEQMSADIAGLSEKLDTIAGNIMDTVAGDVESSFSDNIKLINENLEDKISYIKDDIQGIMLSLAEVDSLVDKVKDAVALQFETYFDSFDSKIDVLGEDIKKYFDNQTDKITSAINEYQSELNNLCDIDLSEYSEDTKKFVEEQISDLKAQLAELQNSDNLDTAVEQITGTVNASSEVINKHLISIRDIMMAEMPNGEEISDNFDDLRAALSDINMKTKGIADIVKDENASLRDVIEKYQAGITALSNLDASSYHDETKGFIKSELQQLKEQFVKNLTSVFENISFIEEAEEIQNVIYDNTDDLKNEINKLKQELVENSNSNDNIDEKFNNLKNILESITSGASVNSGQYLYTLPDVETDIAKMRMAINDITSMLKQNQDDENGVAERLDSIDDIRDDISSISKRTNKLILTSDESNKHLRENISEFRRIIEEVNRKCDSIDNTPIYNNLNDIRALMISSLNSDQTLNEVFMHLAEWIDDSSQTLNAISDKVDANDEKFKEIDHNLDKISERVEKVDDKFDEISRIKDALSDLSAKLDKKLDTDYSKFLYDIECGLDKLSDKLEVQELKIKSLEKKIDNLANAPAANDEVTSLLEFIASQATAANENSRGNKALLQKIDMVEKKVEQFEESISKITAFIDGVN